MSDGMSDARNYGPSLSKHGAPMVSKDGKPVKPDTCSYCGGALGIDRIESSGGGFRHYSKIDCCDCLLIQRKALELQNGKMRNALHEVARAFDPNWCTKDPVLIKVRELLDKS